jgi:hypothetical protein
MAIGVRIPAKAIPHHPGQASAPRLNPRLARGGSWLLPERDRHATGARLRPGTGLGAPATRRGGLGCARLLSQDDCPQRRARTAYHQAKRNARVSRATPATHNSSASAIRTTSFHHSYSCHTISTQGWLRRHTSADPGGGPPWPRVWGCEPRDHAPPPWRGGMAPESSHVPIRLFGKARPHHPPSAAGAPQSQDPECWLGLRGGRRPSAPAASAGPGGWPNWFGGWEPELGSPAKPRSQPGFFGVKVIHQVRALGADARDIH